MSDLVKNDLPPRALRDLDVEQCVDEMFLTLGPGRELLPGQQRKAPAPNFPAPLPHVLREELIGLCAEIVQTARTQKLQSLLICGVEPGAGASFVARNLSRVLAELSRLRIALLTVSHTKEHRRPRARAAVIRQEVNYLLLHTERANLLEIASGQGAVTLTELLCGSLAPLHQMQQEFDFIVVDAPAVAMHAEVAWLAARLDGVILVAEQDVTSLRRLDRAYHRLRRVQANILGLVLNRYLRPSAA